MRDASNRALRRAKCNRGGGGGKMRATQAAARAGVHGSTITRWIKAGRLPARRLASGELEIDEAALDELLEARPSPTRTAGVGSAAVALAVAEERIHGLEMLVETQRGWLADAEARLGLVLQALPPAVDVSRRWWRFW